MRRNKFNAVPTTLDGKWFPSKREAGRYCELDLLERAGKIANLRRQRVYHLDVNGVHICDYRSDFEYDDLERGGTHVVEDAKGYHTRLYEIKRALMLACHGIEIAEV